MEDYLSNLFPAYKKHLENRNLYNVEIILLPIPRSHPELVDATDGVCKSLRNMCSV